MEIKFSSKMHVSRTDTKRVEHSQSGRVCGCLNNILRHAAAALIIPHSLALLWSAMLRNFTHSSYSSKIFHLFTCGTKTGSAGIVSVFPTGIS